MKWEKIQNILLEYKIQKETTFDPFLYKYVHNMFN